MIIFYLHRDWEKSDYQGEISPYVEMQINKNSLNFIYDGYTSLSIFGFLVNMYLYTIKILSLLHFLLSADKVDIHAVFHNIKLKI